MGESERTTFRLYIDECGDDIQGQDGDYQRRYFGLCGVLVDEDFYDSDVHLAFETLKRRFFRFDPDVGLPFHRREMVHATEAFFPLRDARRRRRFDAHLCRVLEGARFHPFIVIIDKIGLEARYSEAPNAYLLALTFLMQRFYLQLWRSHARAVVIAERRSTARDRQVAEAYRQLRADKFLGGLRSPISTDYWFPEEEIRLYSKDRNVSGLQLSDLLARPMTNQALRLIGVARVPGASDFERRILEIASSKAIRPLDLSGKGYSWTVYPRAPAVRAAGRSLGSLPQAR